MTIIGPKPWINPFGKMSIFRLFDLLFFIAYKSVFSSVEYRKRHFPGLYYLKKKVGKIAIFGLKPWVIPLEKNFNFRLFELLVFIAQKGIFSFQNIAKYIFLAYNTLKKMLEKWPFLDQNQGLTPLEKCEFFVFLNLLFLKPREAFFLTRIL